MEGRETTPGLVFRSVVETLFKVRNYVLIPAFVLVAIWFVGRGLEGMTQNAVFEPMLIYWIWVFVFVLLGLWALFFIIHSVSAFVSYPERRHTTVTWIFFVLIVAAVVLTIGGYRNASSGLFALVSGSAESAKQALFLLFKFDPLTPILPIQLLASEIPRGVVEAESLAPFAWSFPLLFGFFVWSLLYGTFLLMFRGKRGMKIVHVFLALLGVFAMMTLKSAAGFTHHQLILLHAGAVVILFIQVLVTYAALRLMSAARIREGEAEALKGLLPPSALGVALVLILLVPLLTDIHNQFMVTRASGPIIEELAKNHKADGPQYVTVTRISVRSGPTPGDEVVGVLPKGTAVSVLKEAYGWFCVGENQWVSPKFLMPVTKKS